MLQLTLFAANGNNGTAEMYIDYQSKSVGFAVITEDKKRFDFSIEKDEWEVFKNFIELQMKVEEDENKQILNP
jgi:hypothetical protein